MACLHLIFHIASWLPSWSIKVAIAAQKFATSSWSIKVSIAAQKLATSTLISTSLKSVTTEYLEQDVTC